MNARALFVIFIGLLVTPTGSPAQSVESEAVAQEEYAVYSVALRTFYDDFNFHAPLWVIANPTVREIVTKKDVQFAVPGAPIGSEETFADYSQRNKTNRWLERRFDLNFKYVTVDAREIKQLLHDWTPIGEWKGFKDKYPTADGFFQLSRVGLSARLDEALVYVSWSCGPLCGYGDLLLLSKKNSEWKVVNRARLWVS
jgi:hypothetical protein